MGRSTEWLVACLEEKWHQHWQALQFQSNVVLQVQWVLDEMVQDVEACAMINDKIQIANELQRAQHAMEVQSERILNLEEEVKQFQANQETLQHQALELASRYQFEVKRIVTELQGKEELEEALKTAREDLQASSHVGRDLAKSQREVRDLQRRLKLRDIMAQSVTTWSGNASHGAAGVGFLTRSNSTSRLPATTLLRSKSLSTSKKSLLPPPSLLNVQLRNTSLSSLFQPSSQDLFTPCLLPEITKVYAFLNPREIMTLSHTCHTWLERVNSYFETPSPLKTGRKPATSLTSSPPLAPVGTNAKAFTTAAASSPLLPKAGRIDGSLREIIEGLGKREMKVFHDLMVRLRELENTLGQVQAEREDVVARLAGVENVRDFLTDKVKEVEEELENTMEREAKTKELRASDQEVIGFLDARTQELERQLMDAKRARDEMEENVLSERKIYENKSKIIEDMAQLINQEKTDSEMQFRAQRKQMARQIKTLYAKNMELEAEKETYRSRLSALKDTIHNLETQLQ